VILRALYVMTIRSVIRAVREALKTVRNPTRGIRRVLRRQMAGVFGKMGTVFHRAQSALLEAELHLPADIARSDLLEALSDAAKVDLVSKFPSSKVLPSELMTESTIKADRKYYAIFKAQVNYIGTDIKAEKYISGYFNEIATSDELMRQLTEKLHDERYFLGYEIKDYTLVNVKHQKNTPY